MIMVKVACPMIITHLMAKRFLLNPIQTGGGGLFEPPLGQSRDNSYTERAMTFQFSDFS